MMRILILSTSERKGGAAIAANRLHEGLRNLGADSHMLVMNKQTDDPRVHKPQKIQRAVGFFQWQSEKFVSNALRTGRVDGPFSNGLFSYQVVKRIKALNPDIINLHWVNDAFVSIPSLSRMPGPIVWSMHDMWPFTGGCHYDSGCGKYRDACNSCPQLGAAGPYDLSKTVFRKKRKAFGRKDLTFVASSNWLAECGRKSALLQAHQVKAIPTGVNLALFKPLDKAWARTLLNLPPKKKLVLFGSMHGELDTRKGFSFLFPALEQMDSANTELVVFGQSQSFSLPDTGVPIRYMGAFSDEPALALLYAAADVLVFPSLQENLGNICMEALASGLPVVAFDVGGNSDMVQHQFNGFLATKYSSLELGQGLNWILENEQRHTMLSKNARNTAVEKFDQQLMTQNYLNLFHEVLGERDKRLALAPASLSI